MDRRIIRDMGMYDAGARAGGGEERGGTRMKVALAKGRAGGLAKGRRGEGNTII